MFGKRPRWYRPVARRRWDSLVTTISIPAKSLVDVEEEFFRNEIIPFYNEMAQKLSELYIKPYMESRGGEAK